MNIDGSETLESVQELHRESNGGCGTLLAFIFFFLMFYSEKILVMERVLILFIVYFCLMLIPTNLEFYRDDGRLKITTDRFSFRSNLSAMTNPCFIWTIALCIFFYFIQPDPVRLKYTVYGYCIFLLVRLFLAVVPWKSITLPLFYTPTTQTIYLPTKQPPITAYDVRNLTDIRREQTHTANRIFLEELESILNDKRS